MLVKSAGFLLAYDRPGPFPARNYLFYFHFGIHRGSVQPWRCQQVGPQTSACKLAARPLLVQYMTPQPIPSQETKLAWSLVPPTRSQWPQARLSNLKLCESNCKLWDLPGSGIVYVDIRFFFFQTHKNIDFSLAPDISGSFKLFVLEGVRDQRQIPYAWERNINT